MRIKKVLYPQEKQWLAEYAGPQEYYLHTEFGGRGWNYRFDRDGHYVYIADDQLATAFLLKFGK